MTTVDKVIKLAAVKRVESAAGQSRYKKSIGSVISAGEEAPTNPAGRVQQGLPPNGGLTGPAATDYQNVLRAVRSALSSGNYDIGIKQLKTAIQKLQRNNGDKKTSLILQRALVRLERTVALNGTKR